MSKLFITTLLFMVTLIGWLILFHHMEAIRVVLLVYLN